MTKLNSVALLVTYIFFPLMSIAQNNYEQDEELDWLNGWTNFDPNHEDYPKPKRMLPSVITKDFFIESDIVYLLSGNVYVTNNATLTIEKGSIIRCDSKKASSLVITKGAKLIANGTKEKPIIFTSNKEKRDRKAGDWGGIIIAGSGKTNNNQTPNVIEGNYSSSYSAFGGDKHNEITTVLSYVRIEFAGQKINQSKELNGLSLYAIGKNSHISNIMISHSGDDSFECFGGLQNMKNLVSYKAKDDDFDFTLGYQGTVDNVLAIRHPYISDSSGSYSVEIDGYDQNLDKPEDVTHLKLTNARIINLSNGDNYKHTKAAISVKSLGKLDILDSQISGFSNVVAFDDSYQSFTNLQEHFSLENSLFNIHDNAIQINNIPQGALSGLLKYNMFLRNFKNASEMYENPLHESNPNFSLKQSRDTYTVMQ